MIYKLPNRDTSKPADKQGLFAKFNVIRNDGSDQPGGRHHGCDYFVLDVTHDQYAKSALSAYAAACKSTHPDLSTDMIKQYGLPVMPEISIQKQLLDKVDAALNLAWNLASFQMSGDMRAEYRQNLSEIMGNITRLKEESEKEAANKRVKDFDDFDNERRKILGLNNPD